MLLLNPPATPTVAGYATIDNAAVLYTGITGASNYSKEATVVPNITASRIAVAYTTVPQIMNTAPLNAAAPAPAIPAYCYRLKTLPSPAATNIVDASGNPFLPNGVLRMHPILAQGVPSFAVDWTDGALDANGNLKWYGYNTGTAGQYGDGPTAALFNAQTNSPSNYAGPNPAIESVGAANGDIYEALFTPANRTLWPKALRFTYRITDSNDRLNGGRSFVCVVDLP